MREVKILGTGCPKCIALTEKVESIAEQYNLELRVEKVSEISEIMNYGVMLTPALVVDGEVKSAGTIPTDDLLKRFLTE